LDEQPMVRSNSSRYLLFAALVMWLLTGWAGARGHFCFDGNEPPMSVHMELVGDHPEHSSADVHMDVDVDLWQLMKAGQFWFWVLISVVGFPLLYLLPLGVAPPRNAGLTAQQNSYFVPPLRAPPCR
jgi:hypothetical protein